MISKVSLLRGNQWPTPIWSKVPLTDHSTSQHLSSETYSWYSLRKFHSSPISAVVFQWCTSHHLGSNSTSDKPQCPKVCQFIIRSLSFLVRCGTGTTVNLLAGGCGFLQAHISTTHGYICAYKYNFKLYINLYISHHVYSDLWPVYIIYLNPSWQKLMFYMCKL